MKELPIQPTQAMIQEGVNELREIQAIDDAFCDASLEKEDLEDAVVFIWQAMISQLNK